MNAIDLQNAFEGRSADNFTAILLRLIAKADIGNREKLRRGFPVEVKAVEIYKSDCPYKDKASTDVDWDKISEMAHEGQGEDGDLRIGIGFDLEKRIVAMGFDRSVSWVQMSAMTARSVGETLIEKSDVLAKSLGLET